MDTVTTNDKPKSGRPMKASDKERRSICCHSKLKPFYTAREIYKEVRGPSVLSLSTVFTPKWSFGSISNQETTFG